MVINIKTWPSKRSEPHAAHCNQKLSVAPEADRVGKRTGKLARA